MKLPKDLAAKVKHAMEVVEDLEGLFLDFSHQQRAIGSSYREAREVVDRCGAFIQMLDCLKGNHEAT